MTAPARIVRFPGLLAVCLAGMLSGCVSSFPINEYNLARSAYDAARDADANRYAPALWYNAEEAYRDGEKAYRERHFDEARERFIQARAASEQAETAARVARQQSGDAP